MRVTLKYGRDGLVANVPDEYAPEVLRPAHGAPLADERSALADAFDNPIGGLPLRKIAASRNSEREGRATAAITVSDITRPVPNRRILPPLLAVLNCAGIPDKQISIIIGTGLHRPSTAEEVDEILGEATAARCRVVSHVARDESSLAYLGETRRGTPIWVNRDFVEADVRIAVSLIEPHFMAGFSGGRKAVCPGLAGVRTMRVLHGPEILSHPNAREGRLEANPFHTEATEIARRAGVDFSVSVTLDEERRITGVFAGDIDTAHRAGCEFAGRSCTATVRAPVDAVITTAAGYPLDLTFYQSVKAMTAALPILKDGGSLIVVSSCDEGIGSPDFVKLMLETESIEQFRGRLADPGFFIPDQWQIQMMCRALDRVEVLYFSEHLPPELQKKLFVTPVPSVEEGLRHAAKRHGPRMNVAVIPDGPYVMPRIIPA